MIIDHIKNASEYYQLGAPIETALRYLERSDFSTIPVGRHALDGDRLYAMVETYQTKLEEDGFWEAHIKYIDIQYIASGLERIGYAPVGTMKPEPYDVEKDFYKLHGEGDFITMREGQFAILKPQDAHMPQIAVDQPEKVKKVVIKLLAQSTS